MRDRIRNVVAATIAGLCLAGGVFALATQPPPFTGVTLRTEGSAVVVDSVDPRAGLSGAVEPGMVVLAIDKVPVDELRPESLAQYLTGNFVELGVADPTYGVKSYDLPDLPAPNTGFGILVGLFVLLGTAVWVRRRYVGEAVRSLGLPLAVASAAPLLFTPSPFPVSVPILSAAVILTAIARLVLADGLVARISPPQRRWAGAAIAVAGTVGYVILEVLVIRSTFDNQTQQVVSAAAVGLLALTMLVPAALVMTSPGHSPEGRLPILLVALTPSMVAVSYQTLDLGVAGPLLWLLGVVVLMQGNARVETLRVQRDTIVAATEVERARLAADLHDDALQEMTVLVRRLDEGGDRKSAELARSIADRLREVCGELRLPILDELGAGPALEWLVGRVGEASGRPILLERADAGRPPANIELAVFRIAQEALANAVTHGAPPIVVRYDAASDRASLSVSDQGDGIAADAARSASQTGHYGLLNMRQRAEQIGARIDFRRPPEGGTVVGMTWAPS